MAVDDLPTEVDLIVVGTGMTESIVAAAASRIGKSVLHIDPNDYYGGLWASFNLENFESLIQNSRPLPSTGQSIVDGIVHLNSEESLSVIEAECEWFVPVNNETAKTEKCEADTEIEVTNSTEAGDATDEKTAVEGNVVWTKEKVLKEFRRFNIDLAPKLLFAYGDLVELLISSNICRYAEFRAVDQVVTLIENELKSVPCSRSDVFTNKNVNVVEKRLLMKVLSICHTSEIDSDEFKEFAGKTFRSYLESKRLTPSLVHYILYAIAMCDDRTLCAEGIKRTKQFLKSLGRYGNTPFLFPMYGCGELPQCFCRLCAVFGGVYCLKRSIEQIHLDAAQNEFQAIKCGEQIIRAKTLVLGNGANYVNQNIFKEHSDASKTVDSRCGAQARGVYILNSPLGNDVLNSGGGGVNIIKLPEQNACRQSEIDTTGAFVIQLSHFSGTCPKDLYLVHITCRSTSEESPRQALQCYEQQLFNESNRHTILWSAYFNIPSCLQCRNPCNELPQNIHIACGSHFQLDYDESICQARALFTKIYSDEEFLPRAPDPEEIIIEGESATDPNDSIVAQEIINETQELASDSGESQEPTNENSEEIITHSEQI